MLGRPCDHILCYKDQLERADTAASATSHHHALRTSWIFLSCTPQLVSCIFEGTPARAHL